jgi:hypothetical protein
MDRIDGLTPVKPAEPSPAPLRSFTARRSSAWRPPGLAWAASFLLLVGVVGLAATTYRWSQQRYTTLSSVPETSTAVLHVAFVPSLPIADVGDALRSAGAKVVEGPDATGIFGVVPVATSAHTADASPELRALAVRLRADARVRWVEPLEGTAAADTLQHGPPQP